MTSIFFIAAIIWKRHSRPRHRTFRHYRECCQCFR